MANQITVFTDEMRVTIACNIVYVTCNLCPGRKSLSASVASNYNLMKHLTSSLAKWLRTQIT